jgi:hypothetical protein
MAAENLEWSALTVKIAKGAVPTADIPIATLGGTLKTNGVQISLVDTDSSDYTIGINMIHDATSTTALEYSHAEITVTKGASIDLDNVLDTVAGAVQSVATLLVDSTPLTDTYLIVIVHLNA